MTTFILLRAIFGNRNGSRSSFIITELSSLLRVTRISHDRRVFITDGIHYLSFALLRITRSSRNGSRNNFVPLSGPCRLLITDMFEKH